MMLADAGLVVWDIDGTLIPADLRWLRRSIAKTYDLVESDVIFPESEVHGYTDESIVLDTAIHSGVGARAAKNGSAKFHQVLIQVMVAGRDGLSRSRPAYPGARETIKALHGEGFLQTV